MGSKALKKNDFRRSISTNAGRHPIFTAHRNRTSISTEDRFPKTALTPISRLKKFQKVRDRNLKKASGKPPVKRSIMMEAVATTSDAIAADISKAVQKKAETPSSVHGTPKKGDSPKKSETPSTSPAKFENGGLNGIPEESPIVENGHQNGFKEEEAIVRRSPRTKSEPKIEEKVETQDIESEEDSEEELEDETPLKILRKLDGPPPSPSRISKSRLEESSSRSVSRDREEWIPYASTRNIRISGRPPLRHESLKRKAECEPFPDDEMASKKMAFTPSVSSPGWRFFSSPFTRFWPNRATVEDDSMVVNLSTDSALTDEPSSSPEVSLFEDSNMEQVSIDNSVERPTAESPQKSSWSCSVM